MNGLVGNLSCLSGVPSVADKYKGTPTPESLDELEGASDP